MIGCPNKELGQKAYKHVAEGLAKVLFDRRNREVRTYKCPHHLVTNVTRSWIPPSEARTRTN